ncbi:MAG: amino acid ABC transporter substrate-binding protein [Neisseriaceae bacterium]|nr:amino acid ABC transporter substrate-binding protein [Neisseriaceae bacterium]
MKRGLWLLFSMLFVTLLTACGGEKKQEQVITRVAKKADYIVAVEPNYAPLALRDAQGLPTGFDVEIMQAIAKDQKFTIEVVSDDFANLWQKMQLGQYDVVIGGVGASEERRAFASFSNPILKDRLALVVRKDSHINSFEEAQGKRFSVQNHTNLKRSLEENPIAGKIITEASPYLALTHVIDNNADALLVDASVAEGLVKDKPNLKVVLIPDSVYGVDERGVSATLEFAISKQKPELVDKINIGLQHIRSEGTYDEIYRKWLGDNLWLKP